MMTTEEKTSAAPDEAETPQPEPRRHASRIAATLADADERWRRVLNQIPFRQSWEHGFGPSVPAGEYPADDRDFGEAQDADNEDLREELDDQVNAAHKAVHADRPAPPRSAAWEAREQEARDSLPRYDHPSYAVAPLPSQHSQAPKGKPRVWTRIGAGFAILRGLEPVQDNDGDGDEFEW